MAKKKTIPTDPAVLAQNKEKVQEATQNAAKASAQERAEAEKMYSDNPDLPKMTITQVEQFQNQPQAPADPIKKSGQYVPNNSTNWTKEDADRMRKQVKNPGKDEDIDANEDAANFEVPTTSKSEPGTYDYIFDNLNAYKPRTAEEIERQRKADKRNALFAAIGDGVSALSNLFFTTKGAPSADHSKDKNLSTAVRKANERWWRDAETREKGYLDRQLRAAQIQQRAQAAEYNMLSRAASLKAKYDGSNLKREQLEAQNKRFILNLENENRRKMAERIIDLAYKLNMLTQQQYRGWNTYIQGRKNGIKTGTPPPLTFDVEGLTKELESLMLSPIDYSSYFSTPQPAAQQPQQEQPEQNQGQQGTPVLVDKVTETPRQPASTSNAVDFLNSL